MSLATLENRLDHHFGDPALLEQALTHRSHGARHNERLEFLGDSVLNFVVAAMLFERYSKIDEGDLSRLRANLVKQASLADIAQRLELSQYLRLGEGELKSGGWRRDSVLADAVEAIVAAIYLDGGLQEAERVCRALFADELENLPDAESLKDPKTRLQEWLQARSRPLPSYEVLSESGPAHRRFFHVRASLVDEPRAAEASGNSRRIAEQQAASELLSSLVNDGAH